MLERLKDRVVKRLYGLMEQEVLRSYRQFRGDRDDGRTRDDYSYVVHYQHTTVNPLAQLCDRHGSDKGSAAQGERAYHWEPHSYTDVYHQLFGHCRTLIGTVFECGLGTNNVDIASSMGARGRPGASLRVWRDYFPNAEIYGADIDRDILFTDDRIRTFHVDQSDAGSVQALWQQVGPVTFDLMIDDGLHSFEAGVCLFEHSIDRLAPGGLYVIEDVTWQDMGRYRAHFARSPRPVSFVNLLRPNQRIGDNSLVMIRNERS